jgi:BioD-like phosphotransacetylase family protein
VYDDVSARFDKAGITVLGVLPEDRVLSTLAISELAAQVQGELLNATEESAELAENFMLGAMTIDSGLAYYGRKGNKVSVIRGERSDMQLAALETSTRCLILTGNTAPLPVVVNRAEEKRIPIVLAKRGTADIVTDIEDALGKARFNQEKKLPKLTEIMGQYFDFKVLYRGLGLTS